MAFVLIQHVPVLCADLTKGGLLHLADQAAGFVGHYRS
jgi:hypothetical protein